MSLIDSASAEFRGLLLNELMPFWFHHGVDREFGGVLSVMQEDGKQLSTDKYLWSQGRWLWVVSAVYNRLEQRPEFLQSARDTAQFLLKHGPRLRARARDVLQGARRVPLRDRAR